MSVSAEETARLWGRAYRLLIDDFELKGKDALVTLATVEADGTVHREALLAPDRQDAILRPMACTQVADDRMFIYATRKNDYQYGYITFQ